MYEFSLVLGFGWMAIGLAALVALTRKLSPLPLALALSSLASTLIDFTGGSIAAMAFGPIIVLIATHAILAEVPRLKTKPAGPAKVKGFSSQLDATDASALPQKKVLLLRPRSPRSHIWLAHNGRTVIQVVPTCGANARSGCRVNLIEKTDGSFWVITD